jgi:hypothetical protein
MSQSAEVVALDDAGRVYGVCAASTKTPPAWVIFIGERAGLRAYAYADETYGDVKTGHLAPDGRRAVLQRFGALAV